MNNTKKRYTLTHYLLGALPARLGDEMSGQALLLMCLAATGSLAAGSSLLATLTCSAAIGGPLLGAVLDRARYPGRILSLALGLYAAGLAAAALLLGRVPVWIIAAIALLAGFCMPSISGGWSSRLKSFVDDEQMTRASAIDAATFNIAGLAGAGTAGLIAAWAGAGWAVAVLVSLLVAAMPMAWSLPRRGGGTRRPGPFTQDVAAGFTAIMANAALFRITCASVLSYLGIGMLWVIYPIVGKELMGGAGYGGLLASALSVAALLATVLYARWPTEYSPDAVAFATTLVLAAATLLLAYARTVFIAFAAVLIAGLADGPQLAAVFAVRHREAPERSRSQVFTTGASLKITAAAVGTALAGPIAMDSRQFALLAAAGAQCLAAVLFVALSKPLTNAKRARPSVTHPQKR